MSLGCGVNLGEGKGFFLHEWRLRPNSSGDLMTPEYNIIFNCDSWRGFAPLTIFHTIYGSKINLLALPGRFNTALVVLNFLSESMGTFRDVATLFSHFMCVFQSSPQVNEWLWAVSLYLYPRETESHGSSLQRSRTPDYRVKKAKCKQELHNKLWEPIIDCFLNPLTKFTAITFIVFINHSLMCLYQLFRLFRLWKCF